MANNIIRRTWKQGGLVNIEDLRGSVFQAEDGGHTFLISGVDENGDALALSGTPAGVLLRADGQDVTLTCSVSDGVVSATLPANAYVVPGRVGITIFLTSGGQKTAIYAAVGSVATTSSGIVAPPAGSDVVDLVNAIATAVATIPASYTDLMAAVAPTYSTSALYAVGSYAWYSGKLYRCTTAITSGETWTSAHWTQANLGSDVSDLKSAFISLTKGIEINVSSSSSVVTNVPIIAGLPYIFDMTVSNGSTAAYVNGYSSDSVNLLNGVVEKTFQNSGYLGMYISSQRTITGKVYIDPEVIKQNFAHIVNIPSLQEIKIKTKKVSESVYNTNRKITTSNLTLDNFASKVASDSYQYTFDPIRIRNSDGALVYNNLHMENIATLQTDQICCYAFDKNGKYLRNVMFNTMVSRNPVFASDEYFAALVEFPNSEPMKAMKWVVDDVNIEWLKNSTEIQEVLNAIIGQTMTASASSGDSLTTVYVNAGIEYAFDTEASRLVSVFVDGHSSDVLKIKAGKSISTKTFQNSGYLKCYAGSAYSISGKVYQNLYDQKKDVYYVGEGKDFETFTGMLTALANDAREKTVYVDPGEYDIFEEMGGSELIDSIDDPTSESWLTYAKFVPPNTKIIGVGHVVLKWTPDANVIGSRDMAFLFSPLNIAGTCRIENITVLCKNGRYCIHDEGSGSSDYDNAVHEFINVRAELLADSTYDYTNAYGSGHNRGMKLLFDSCEFVSKNGAFSTHDNIMTGMGDNDSALIEIKNCVIRNHNTGNYCIKFYSRETGNMNDIVRIYNTYTENGDMSFECPPATEGSFKQGYDVTMIGCTNMEVRHQANISNPTNPKQYNSFGN